jgi:hypothetical protein
MLVSYALSLATAHELECFLNVTFPSLNRLFLLTLKEAVFVSRIEPMQLASNLMRI